MDTIAILALAARHYGILNRLKKGSCGFRDLEKETQISRSTLDDFTNALVKAGLVEKKKVGRKYEMIITRSGEIALDYIDKFGRMIFKPSFSDELKSSINEIMDYYKTNYRNSSIEEIISKQLSQLCRTKPDALFSHEIQDFILDYIGKSVANNEIDDMIFYNLRHILQNIELRNWFYGISFPIIVSQSKNKAIADLVRNVRIRFLWEIFRLDEDKRDDILNTLIDIIEDECQTQQREVCLFIYSSYPRELNKDIIKRFMEKHKTRILDKFFHPN